MDKVAQMEEVAHEIISQARASIVLKMRFMDLAVFKLKPIISSLRLSTDGVYLYYQSRWIINRYKNEPNAVVRDYMHALLHCIFRHPFHNKPITPDLWDLSCDMAVEAIIIDLKQQIMETKDEVRKSIVVNSLRSTICPLTAEKLYSYFLKNPPSSEWYELFKSDDHELWHSIALRNEIRMETQQQEAKENSNTKKENGNNSIDSNDRDSTTQASDDTHSNNTSSERSSSINKLSNDNDKNIDHSGDKTNSCSTSSVMKSNESSSDMSDESTENSDCDADTTSNSEERRKKTSSNSIADSLDKNEPSSKHTEKNTASSKNLKDQTDQETGGEENNENKTSKNTEQGNTTGTPKLQESYNANQETGGKENKNKAGENTEQNTTSGFPSFQKYNTISANLESTWKSISERIQMDIDAFANTQGYEAGSLTQMLKHINREKYDYASFLKKFAVLGEEMKINDDEFDYVFYTYGLKLYKNMPLIEPLEYKEVKRIREFVIVIDTSGSTSGELVQWFLTKTWNILHSTESFFSKVNIHIVQCDAQIQEDVRITTKEEFERYIQTMTIRGLGGTDFRPVFSYVDQLIKQNEFMNLKGLIYFTDGIGTFPVRKPDYTTAFVFIQDQGEYNNLNVPSWAIKLILEKDEI